MTDSGCIIETDIFNNHRGIHIAAAYTIIMGLYAKGSMTTEPASIEGMEVLDATRDGKAFHEYGGVEITEAQLRKCRGAAAVLDGIKRDGGELGEIFYRGNGVINVNHHTAAGRVQVTRAASACLKNQTANWKYGASGR